MDWLADGFAVVGNRIQGAGFAHAFPFVKNDEALGGTFSFETDLNGALGQMARTGV